MRSANRGNAYNTWNVNSSGNVNNNNASNANRSAPIVLPMRPYGHPVRMVRRTHQTQGAEIPGGKPKQYQGDGLARMEVNSITSGKEKNMNQHGKEYIIDFDQLYDAMTKCQKNVMWKPSVKSFVLNDLENLIRMEKKLKDGTWKNGEPKPIQITYPKKREGLSISFKDRVYQRSINDNALYPATTSTFIKDNWACQTGKGPDIARERMKAMLWDFYLHYGLDGCVVQTDIHGYYQSMRHKDTEELFKRYIDPEVHKMVRDVLNAQYKGDTGYNPGSQMVQIAGITALNDMDHFIKEKLHVHYYGRYMDDSAQIYHKREDAERNLEIIEQKLNAKGFEMNKKKTRIAPISEPFLFLGFYFHLTGTGKVIMTLDPDNVKHERRKLRKMVAKAKRGEMTKEKVDECYHSWKNHAEKGSSYKLLQRMDQYYKDLWRDDKCQS